LTSLKTPLKMLFWRVENLSLLMPWHKGKAVNSSRLEIGPLKVVDRPAFHLGR
jgi:hypothetical protein